MVFICIGAVFVGVILGALIVLFIIVKAVRAKISDEIERTLPYKIYDGAVKEVKRVIKAEQKSFARNNRGKALRSAFGLKKKKNKSIVYSYKETVESVAKVFNPNSRNPVFEFSIKEAFDFLRDVTVRLEKVLDAINLSLLKNCNLSVVYGMTKLVVTVKDNKIVKTAVGVWGKVRRILNILNPFYWFKKISQAVFATLLANELVFSSIDVVGWTFAEFYHKCNCNGEEYQSLEEVI